MHQECACGGSVTEDIAINLHVLIEPYMVVDAHIALDKKFSSDSMT